MSSPKQTSASHPKAPRDASRFYTKGEMTHYVGIVEHEGGHGSFLEEGEDLPETVAQLYGRQPPLFQPRDEWYHWDEFTFKHPGADDDDDLIRRKLDRPGAKQAYFQNPYIRETWPDHAFNCWRLYHDLSDQKKLTDVTLCCLLKMLQHGLEDIVAVGRLSADIPKRTIQRNDKTNPPSPFLPGHYLRISSHFEMGFSNSFEWRCYVRGKRFFAGFVRHNDYDHYTTFIWDRLRGHLYHFDSYASDQMVRARCVALMWRERLGWAGLPYSFSLYAIPLTQQPDEWECGLLSFHSLFTTLRGLVGVNPTQLAKFYPPTILQVDGIEQAPFEPFDLLVRDWVLDPWMASKAGNKALLRKSVETLIAMYQCALFDEIGIKDSRLGGRRLQRCDFLRLISYRPSSGNGQISKAWLSTDFGGYMLACPNNIGVVPGWATHRILLPAVAAENEVGNYRTCRGVAMLMSGTISPVQLPNRLTSQYLRRGLAIRANIPVYTGSVKIDLEADSDEESQSRGKGADDSKKAYATTIPPASDPPPRASPGQIQKPRQPSPKTPSQKMTLTPRKEMTRTSTSHASDQSVSSQKKPPAEVPNLRHPLPDALSQKKATPPRAETPARATSEASDHLGSSQRKPSAEMLKARQPPLVTPSPKRTVPSPARTTSWTPSEPFSRLGLNTPKKPAANRQMAGEGEEDEYYPSSTGDSDEDIYDATPPPSNDQLDDIEVSTVRGTQGRRQAIETEFGVNIQGGETLHCSDYDTDEGVNAGRSAVGKGTHLMSVLPGETSWLACIPHRETERLPSGNYATHVPAGMVRPTQWDRILDAAVKPWVPAEITRQSRAERYAKREQRGL